MCAIFDGLDPTQWTELEPVYQGFIDREILSADELEKWLFEIGDFDAFVGETSAMLYVEMTCNTEDEAAKQAYLDFVENVEPNLALISDQLNRKFAYCPYADELDATEYL